MKKNIALILMLALIFSLISCGGEPTPPNPTVYDELNGLLNKEYKRASMTVTETAPGIGVISGTYEIEGTDEITVTYTFELFSVIDPTAPIPDKIKQEYSGSMVVKDGKITAQNGEPCNVTVETIGAKNLVFNGEYFENVSVGGGLFSARVKNPGGFMGISGATDMTVSVVYDDVSHSISISYVTQNGNKIEISYSLS